MIVLRRETAVTLIVFSTFAWSVAVAQTTVTNPVAGGCPPLPAAPGFSSPYIGGQFPMPDQTGLANVDFFPTGICLTSAGGATFFFALPAAAVAAAFSGAAPPAWDELVVQDQDNRFHDISPPVFGNPLMMTNFAPPDLPLGGCVQINPARNAMFKCLVWNDATGQHNICNGLKDQVISNCGFGANLTAIPGGAPALAGNRYGDTADGLAFDSLLAPSVYAAPNVGNIQLSFTGIPNLQRRGFGVLVILLGLTAYILLRRRMQTPA